jgi:hypothetical protein
VKRIAKHAKLETLIGSVGWERIQNKHTRATISKDRIIEGLYGHDSRSAPKINCTMRNNFPGIPKKKITGISCLKLKEFFTFSFTGPKPHQNFNEKKHQNYRYGSATLLTIF